MEETFSSLVHPLPPPLSTRSPPVPPLPAPGPARTPYREPGAPPALLRWPSWLLLLPSGPGSKP